MLKFNRRLITQFAIFSPFIFSFILLVYSSRLVAGPPFITDDPYVPDYKRGEYHLFFFGQSLTHQTFIMFPALEIEYGILPNLEFHIIPSLGANFQQGQNNAYGLVDTEVALKYLFLTEDKHGIAASIEPYVFLATADGDHGLGNGRTYSSLALWAAKHIGKWLVYGGAARLFNAAFQQKNFWYGGLVIERQFREDLMFGVEFYCQGKSATSIDVDGGPFKLLNLGGTYDFNDSVALDFSVGHSINGEKQWVSFIGLSIEFGQGEEGKTKSEKNEPDKAVSP